MKTMEQLIAQASSSAAKIIAADNMPPGHVDYMNKTDMANAAASIMDDLADILQLWSKP